MATGYTAPVEDGTVTTLADFASTCAPAFGVFIHLRDASDKTLRYPDAPDDTYESSALSEAKRKRTIWLALTEEERYARWSEYVSAQNETLHKAKAKRAQSAANYYNMLAQVTSKDVPSKLENFKDFMIEQLESSLKFDCGSDETWTDTYYRVLDFFEWQDHEEKRFNRDVDYYAEALKKSWVRYYEACDYITAMSETFGFEVEGAIK